MSNSINTPNDAPDAGAQEKEQVKEPPTIIIIGCGVHSVALAMAQLSEAYEREKPRLLLIKQEIDDCIERLKRPSFEEMAAELNKVTIELSNARYELPPEKPKWKGKKGFNSARNRVIT